MPTLSVILPNYNYARYLPQRIESILNQSFTDFELIILDDASTDNSRQIIDEYKQQDKRIRTLYNTHNSSNPFIQWKKGIELTTGKFIWVAEADDWAETNLIDELIPAFEDEKTIISFCQSNIADSENEVIGKWKYHNSRLAELFKANNTFNGKELINQALIHENILPNASAVIFKKSAYKQVKGINTSLKSNADWLLWLKLATIGNISYINKPLNYFRRHEKSVIANIKTDAINYTEQYDRQMRKLFRAFIKKTNTMPLKNSLAENSKFIAYDNGNEALFHIKRKQYIKAFLLLVKASTQLKTLGYIKKAYKHV